MATEKIYPKGIMTFPKSPKAPEFILGTIVITPNDLMTWLKGEGSQYITEYKDQKQIRLTLLQGKDKVNIQVDTYRPTNNSATTAKADDDLPF